MTDENSPSPTPKRAIYGFVIYLVAHLTFVIYVIWAFLPDEWLRAAGFTYYPNKHWAVTVPISLLIGYFLAYPIYMMIAMFNAAPLTSLDTITDKYAIDFDSIPNVKDQIMPIADVPISRINRHLYFNQQTSS